jgi:hypothetical protein
MHVAFPGLSRTLASREIVRNFPVSLEALADSRVERTGLVGYSYTDVNNQKVSVDEVLAQSERVREIFEQVSGSKRYKAKGNVKTDFDEVLVQEILDIFPMNTFEASLEETWSFIAIRPLADIATWRFPTEEPRPLWERYIGMERNAFKRIWWRAHMLGPDLASQLRENELIQMFERGATIGSNKLILERISRSAITNREELEQLGGKTSDFITECAKRLRRTLAVDALELMTREEATIYVDARLSEAFASYKNKRLA